MPTPEGRINARAYRSGGESQPPPRREILGICYLQGAPARTPAPSQPECSREGGMGPREPPRPLCLHVSQMTGEESLRAGTVQLSAGSI